MPIVQVSAADEKTQKTFYVDSYPTLLVKIEGQFGFKPTELRVKNEEDRGDRVDNEHALEKLFSKYGNQLMLEVLPKAENQDLAEPDSGRRYNMNNVRRGLAVIIYNENFKGGEVRHGSKADAHALSLSLTKLHFRVCVHRNLTAYGMADIMTNYGKKDYSNDDCIVCAFMSYGDNGVVYGVDFEKCPERYLKEPIKRNKSLKGKPKIFFIQACRGTVELNNATRVGRPTEWADLVDKADLVDEAVADGTWNEEADFFVQYSTVEAYVSFRNSERGSWFIQSLASILRERGKKDELCEMALDVNNQVAKRSAGEHAQVSCISSRLLRKVYFPAKEDSNQVQEYENGFYVGEFLNDKRHGKGTFYFKSGITFEGVWFDGMNSEYSDVKHEGRVVRSERDGISEKVEGVDWKNDPLVSHLKDPSPERAFDGCSSLGPSMQLKPGIYMESVNKRYKAFFEKDGNFVLSGWMSILWSTETAGSSAIKLVMQTDGNLVLYDKNSKELWASGTHGKGPSKATLQDNGNFVIYDANGNATWSTQTGELCKSCSTLKSGQLLTLGGQMMSPNGLYKAVLGLDGVFAIYHDRFTVWATNTRKLSF